MMLKTIRRVLIFSAAGLWVLALSAMLALLTADQAVLASDHGDRKDEKLELRLTDLYAFIRDGNLVLILNSNPEVHKTQPNATEESFKFPENVKFEIDIDRDTPVDLNKDPDRLGGTISKEDAERIDPDIVFTIETSKYGKKKPKLKATGFPRWKVQWEHPSLKDDPFIRNTRCGANVVATVLQMPLDDIYGMDQPHKPLLIWATSSEKSPSGFKQVDHAGRALRSMFEDDFKNPEKMNINILPPKEHQTKLDVQPDVIILNPDNLTNGRVEYPNGRELEDDVVTIEGRPDESDNPITKNDKPFLEKFPYLAEPHDPPAKPINCPRETPQSAS